MDEWLLRFRLSSELKGQILQAIETALVSLPVEELPEAELVLISEGVRDQLYNRAVQAQAAAAGHGQQKLALQRYGMDYAQMELRAVEGLDFTERWRIETLVREELGELAGDESRDEVMAWVDEILEREGLELEDDPDAD